MDIYDGAAWTEMDIEDLKAAIEHGSGIEEAAELLCRADSVDDVAHKAEELQLKTKRRRRYTGTDSESAERPEIEHFGNCDVCGALVDMRDLAQVMEHMHGREPLDLTGQPDPDVQ